MPYKDLKQRRKYHKDYAKAYRKKKGEEIRKIENQYSKSSKGHYSIYKKSAKKVGRDFQITFLEYEQFFFKKECSYCPELNTTGIDRVDNSVGYILSNCVPCCEWCNRMKLDYTKDDFIKQCVNVAIKVGGLKERG